MLRQSSTAVLLVKRHERGVSSHGAAAALPSGQCLGRVAESDEGQMRVSRVLCRRIRDLTWLLTFVAVGEAIGAGLFVGWAAPAKEPAVSSNAVPGLFPPQEPLRLRLSEKS
jgi:hypothetical protein